MINIHHERVLNDNPYTNNTSLPLKKNIATVTLNDWKDSLPLRVAMYAKFINKNWDEFTINITTCTIK